MTDDTPPLNRLFQEALDLAGEVRADQAAVLEAIIMLATERLAAISGPDRAAHVLTRGARQLAGEQAIMPEFRQ